MIQYDNLDQIKILQTELTSDHRSFQSKHKATKAKTKVVHILYCM